MRNFVVGGVYRIAQGVWRRAGIRDLSAALLS
jgi:hypothetical protein